MEDERSQFKCSQAKMDGSMSRQDIAQATSSDTWYTNRYPQNLGSAYSQSQIMSEAEHMWAETTVGGRTSFRLNHPTLEIAKILGTRGITIRYPHDTYRDTWVAIRYVSRYLGRYTIRIAILAENGKMD